MWRYLVSQLTNERGGGSKPQPAQFIQAPPPQIIQAPPPQANLGPSVQQNAADLYQAQLQYNPQLTAQAVGLQQQYGPQLAQNQVDIQGQLSPQLAQQQFALQQQYGPLYRSLYEQIFPTQTQGLETLSQQANQRFASPQGYTPQQQTAVDAIRERQRFELSRTAREQANLGGNLYGGRSQERELRAQAELANQYAQQDIQNQFQNRGQALQEFVTGQQVAFPQIQQPGAPQVGTPQYGQGVTPNPDALLQAILQGQIVQQPIYQPGNPGTPGFFGSMSNAYSR